MQPSGTGGPPPVPVLAQLTRAGTILRVEFDRTLRPGPSDPANWRGRDGLNRLEVQFMDATGVNVVGANRQGRPITGTPRVTYLATPPDVVSLDGTPVERFIAFPLDVFP